VEDVTTVAESAVIRQLSKKVNEAHDTSLSHQSAMTSRCPSVAGTLTPFLYPFLLGHGSRTARHVAQKGLNCPRSRSQSTASEPLNPETSQNELSHLNPAPFDYSRTIFADRATITLHAGSGGHGCISFLREKYIAAGPANGGDGGSGGNIYIQAVRGETSLHKLARRRNIKAGRGKNGQGKTRGGERGEDIIVQVPVGTVVKEIDRVDPVAIEEGKRKLEAGKQDGDEEIARGGKGPYKWSRDKWLLYPAITPEDVATAEFPVLPKARRSHLSMLQPEAPITLDLSQPMEKPMLLAAGAVGGLGNPHFVTKSVPRPKYATKGEDGMKITLELELKLLADVGFVGLPNAGKSTLLRAMSNSRARVGNWAFTTLQPNIGTVILDNHHGRPQTLSTHETGEPRTNFTIADIPGLVQDAHLDRGLGISFLRHVERAHVLAFVIDLNAGDAVQALKALWKEVGAYERMKKQEEDDKKELVVQWRPFQAPAKRSETIIVGSSSTSAPETILAPSIAGKPWFVVATKADLPGTKENFENLVTYMGDVKEGREGHPSGQKNGWCEDLEAIPVSAINGHGVKRITEWTVGLLDR
jgi:GTP-binding protein